MIMGARSVWTLVVLAAVVMMAPTAAGAACGAGGSVAYTPGSTTEDVNVASITGIVKRSFNVFVPSTYSASSPVPLVFMLHGGLGTGAQFERSSGMSAYAEKEGFAVVYGNGYLRTWNAGKCCGRGQVDDVAYMRAVLAQVQEGLCVDEERVYAIGMSNGAMMAHRLACDMADKFAAIGPVAGGIEVENTCSTAVPVFQVHGTLDANVPWSGGKGECGVSDHAFTSIPATMQAWAAPNQCAVGSTGGSSCVVDKVMGNGVCKKFSCENAPLVLCAISGGSHSYPGQTDTPAGDRCKDNQGSLSSSFIANEVMWGYFKAITRSNRAATAPIPSSATSADHCNPDDASQFATDAEGLPPAGGVNIGSKTTFPGLLLAMSMSLLSLATMIR